MKQCPRCGQFFADGASVCYGCGAPLDGGSADDSGRQYPPNPSYSYPGQPGAGRRALTKEEFMNLPENAKMKKEIKSAGILCYVFAAMTGVAALNAGNMNAILDVLLLIGLGLGIQLKQSRVCAIILCLAGALTLVWSLAETGTPGGYLVLIAGIYAIINTFKLDKAWKAYQGQ